MRIFIGITGASGSVYAERLIAELLKRRVARIYICFSKTALKVVKHELDAPSTKTVKNFLLRNILVKKLTSEQKKIIRVFATDDFFSPVASGSSAATHTIIVPCSMGCLARIRHGVSSNLIERVADVSLKQKNRLLLCPRETPLSTIHLENMLYLSKMGVDIVPPMPGFYQKPKTIDEIVDFFVGKILELLAIEHDLYKAWNNRLA